MHSILNPETRARCWEHFVPGLSIAGMKRTGCIDRALQLQPGHAPAHMFRAMARLCQGDIEAAESGLRRSTELDPLSASDCARMAYLHYVKGDYPSAAEHLRQSFELDRDYPEARLYEGLLHFQQQRYEAVIQCLSPSDFPLDIGLLAAAHAQKGSLKRAGECIERLHQLASRQYVTPLAEGFAAVGMKRFRSCVPVPGRSDQPQNKLCESAGDRAVFPSSSR